MNTPRMVRFRVTSIPKSTKFETVFTGVPLDKNNRVSSGKEVVTVVVASEFLPVKPSIGQHWGVNGDLRVNVIENHGYKISQHTYEDPAHLECQLPETGEQLIKFIAEEKDFKGIGEAKARALWVLLGDQFHHTMQLNNWENRKLLRQVLTDDSIDALYEGYQKYKNLSQCNWMFERRIPSHIQQRLVKSHGESTIKAIEANPYLLCTFGMSFTKVDELAQIWSYPIPKNDERRLSAALEMSLRDQISKGHTYSNRANLIPTIRKYLHSTDLVNAAFFSGYNKSQYILQKEDFTFHPPAQLLMESVVAKRLLKLASVHGLYDTPASLAYRHAYEELPYPLTDQQKLAVGGCLDNKIACITGGAGTGKTTVLRTALRAFAELGYIIHAVALSGRAAMRLKESIGMETMTIARFLSNPPIEDEDGQNLLVIDETSMVDLPTMYRIVTHINPSVRVLLVGDPDQLPPIGCGKVLADIVESKEIENTMLDIVKRQEGSTGIPEYSKLINAGTVPSELSTGAITFHETAKDDIASKCSYLYAKAPSISRVISPTKALTADINTQIQRLSNASGKLLEFEMYGELTFLNMREGDSVLFTKNLYHRDIQNGSLGILSSVEGGQFETVEGLEETYYGEVILDTGEEIKITEEVLDCMELGYAITLHKAQGSQFPRIIIALKSGKIVDRAWLYTAITRAEAEIHIVGSEADLRAITTSPSNASKRNSYLKKLLEKPFCESFC